MPEPKLQHAKAICQVHVGQHTTRHSLVQIVGFVTLLKHAVPQVQVYLHEAYALVGGQCHRWDQPLVILPAVAHNLQWVTENLQR